MTIETARTLADCAADKLERLAEDIAAEQAALDALRRTRATYTQPLATDADRAALAVRDSANEAAGSLERLCDALPYGLPSPRDGAASTAKDEAKWEADCLRSPVWGAPILEWAAAWRTFADA